MTDDTKNDQLAKDLLQQKTSNLCALTFLIGGHDFAELADENKSSIMQVMTAVAIDVQRLANCVFPNVHFDT